MTPEVILASLLWSVTQLNAVDIQLRLDRMLVVTRVMYVAAHPDDENTQLLTYLSHGRGAQTAYLSLTRGDGGQNLIGSEQSPLLGVIRSHELMAARALDGAEQRFTRARDFGYSKRAEEALEVWGRDATLADVVWAVRRFRPHVIITRFPETGKTHGHHLASAILARDAFRAAADETMFSEQLNRVAPWQAERLVFNVPNRFMPEEERPDDLVVDIGGFSAATGQSHGEIAAASRSMHKSQGFGAARRFGPEPERFRHLEGSRAESDLLEGVPSTWSDVPGGQRVGQALDAAREKFRAQEPGRIVGDLAKALQATAQIEDALVRSWAQRELGSLLIAASGVLLEARSETAAVVPGDELDVEVLALNRGDTEIRWVDVEWDEDVTAVDTALANNEPTKKKLSFRVPEDTEVSTFPWLDDEPLAGRYVGSGDADTPLPSPPITVRARLVIAGAAIDVHLPVRHFWTDRVAGERHRDVEVLPPITATPATRAMLVPCGSSGCEAKLRIAVKVRRAGVLRFEMPAGYRAEPAEIEVTKDAEIDVAAHAEPGATRGAMKLVATSTSGATSWAERSVDHAHVPARTALLPSQVALTSAALTVPDVRIGHIAGPGDDVARGLANAGFDIVDLDDDALARGRFDGLGAILVGVRAFNTREAVRKHHQQLFDFAERGGTVLIQYATKPRRKSLGVPLLPYAMEIGRGRVTNHRAAVTLLEPEHPLMAQPHRIGDDDFADWVQERGLYFGNEWDQDKVTPLLSMADVGEEAELGALLVSDHGEGRVIYAGLSLFRQVPAGVPGAYRLLSNLLTPRGQVASNRGDEPPPVLGRWRNFYLLVVFLLVVLIAAFYLLKRRYSA